MAPMPSPVPNIAVAIAKTTMRCAAGALLLALALEGSLRLLPVSTATLVGYHHDPDVLTYPANHRFTSATGWDLRNVQAMQANAAGFIADLEFTPNQEAVALIGDSIVESSGLAAHDRPAAQLQSLLGAARPVYAMGSPGTSLLDYAERMRLARERWGVRDMVVLINLGDVSQSLCGSGQVASPCLNAQTRQPGKQKQPAASPLKDWARQSALAQYVFSQLKASPERLWPTLKSLPATLLPIDHAAKAAPETQRGKAPIDPELLDAVIDLFFDRIRPISGGRLVFVIDRPLPGRATASLPVEESDRMAKRAREVGATVVDMASVYAKHAATSEMTLGIGPYDWHPNRRGVRLLAQEAARGLAEASPWRPPMQ
jgi:hypothetical protein